MGLGNNCSPRLSQDGTEDQSTSFEKNIPVRMRDGVTIYCDVLRPAIPERFPAILHRNPYNKSRPAPAQDHFRMARRGQANGLGGDGTLSLKEPGDEDPDHFGYDPNNPVPTVGGSLCCADEFIVPRGAHDQREVERRSDLLVYTSKPTKTILLDPALDFF